MKKQHSICLILMFLAIVGPLFAQYDNVAITSDSYEQSEVTIAISPLNSNYLLAVWNEFREGHPDPGYAFSTNGGSSWSEAIVNPGGYSRGFDPSAGFDRYGNAFYCYVASNVGLGRVYVSRTDDEGDNWNNHEGVSDLSDNQDKPFMTIDNTGGTYDGRIYVSWTDISDWWVDDITRIKFSYSTDNGTSFSSDIELASTETSGDPDNSVIFMPSTSTYPGVATVEFVQGSVPVVGINNKLYVVWMNIGFGDNGSSYKIRKSINGGASFEPARTVAQFTYFREYWGQLDAPNFPSMAIDQNTGKIYVVYKDRESQSNSTSRIKIVYSTDEGVNWSSPSIITNLSGGGEVFPWVDVDTYGVISVSFMHRKTNGEVDNYVTESYNNGQSFRSPVKVSSESSDPSDASWTHHYLGIVIDNNSNNYSVWTDYRNNNVNPYFAKVNTPPSQPQNFSISGSAGQHPTCSWSPNTEPDLDGYKLYKNEYGHGWALYRTLDENTTSYTDNSVTIGPGGKFSSDVCYKVSAFDVFNQESSYSRLRCKPLGSVSKQIADFEIIPNEYALHTAYPNPFNPSTKINYQLPTESDVSLTIYSIQGKLIKTLVNKRQDSGYYNAVWNGVNNTGNPVSSGMYLILINAVSIEDNSAYTASQKVVLLQ